MGQANIVSPDRRKVVAVFGASSGIGFAFCQKLHDQYRLISLSREAPPSQVEWRPCDVRDAISVRGALQEFGPQVDAVVNCAGIGAFAPFETRYADYWKDIIETNLLGAINIISAVREVTPNASDLVAIGSMAARRTSPTPGNDVYAATKAAFVRVHDDFRARLRQNGERLKVTVITPGFVEGTQFGRTFFRSNPDAEVDLFAAFQSLRPDDVSEAIQWCLTRPDHVEISELALRPREQAN